MQALQGVLYGGAPFFSYPWKPLINASVGSAYSIAYQHFRRDHQLPTNLVAHLGCLVWQLGSNYAFLDAIDAWIDTHRTRALGDKVAELLPRRTFAKLTTITWCLSLVAAKGCPLIVKAASLASIGKWPRGTGGAASVVVVGMCVDG
jgi:hypothetical protein